MKNILATTAFMTALLCGASLAQNATPSSTDSSSPQAQPQAQPTTPSQAQPQAKPQPAPQAAQDSSAASASNNPAQPTGTRKIAAGSVIPVELTKTINAKKAKAGDEVVARVTQDLKSNSGEVLVPKDTKVVGHVTEAQARTKEQKESEVAIAFDHAVMKSGDMQLPMSIQAIIGPQNNANNANAGGSEPASPSAMGTPQTSPMAGRAPVSGQPPTANTPPPTSPGDSVGTNAAPAINGNTQGVIGISDLKLAAAPNAGQGSVVTSEKNNVKLDSGTFMLLRVNP